MRLWEIIIVSVGLALDAFTVAVCRGSTQGNLKKSTALLVGIIFGAIQTIMLAAGMIIALYPMLNINNEKDLIKNLKEKLEKLNKIKFTDKEWEDLFNNIIANPNDGIIEKTKKIQEDYKQILTLENGEVIKLTLNFARLLQLKNKRIAEYNWQNMFLIVQFLPLIIAQFQLYSTHLCNCSLS